ncbi:MAG: hypothetical protein R3E97_16605 [Candidatus Eisenbacteria bacterium]
MITPVSSRTGSSRTEIATRPAKLALDSAFDGGRVGHRLESVAQAVLFDSEDKKARRDAVPGA